MDFGLQPPAGFELGHTQEYYKAKLPRFHVTDEPWGKTFTGGIVESFGQSGTVSGGFDGDVVTALAIGISEDSTLCGVPLFQPLDRLANQLEHAGLEVARIVAEDEEYTQMHIASPGFTFYVIADQGQPSALYWLKPTTEDA